MGKQIDQAGEIMLREGVGYGPHNVPLESQPLHRGRMMRDVSLVRKRGDTVEVTQFVRTSAGVFYVDPSDPDRAARRLVLVDAKHFKLKYGVERKRTKATEENCATIQALGQVERQHEW